MNSGYDTRLRTLRKFVERVQQGRTADMAVLYRVSGGLPKYEEELRLHGNGQVKAHVRDALDLTSAKTVAVELDETEVRELFRDVATGLEELATQQDFSFVPDALVGSITVEVEGERAELFFAPRGGGRTREGKQLPAKKARAVERLEKISARLLRKKE